MQPKRTAVNCSLNGQMPSTTVPMTEVLSQVNGTTLNAVVDRLPGRLTGSLLSLPHLSDPTFRAIVNRASADLLAQALPAANSSTIRAATDHMSATKLLRVIEVLNGDQVPTVIGNTTPQRLGAALNLADWPVARGVFNRLDDVRLAEVLNQVNATTLNAVVDRLAGRLTGSLLSLPQLSDPTFRAIVDRGSADLLAQALPSANNSTIRAATDHMSTTKLLRIIEIQSGDGLLKTLRNTTPRQLASVVEQSDSWGARMGIVKRLDGGAQSEVINLVSAATRKGIKSRM